MLVTLHEVIPLWTKCVAYLCACCPSEVVLVLINLRGGFRERLGGTQDGLSLKLWLWPPQACCPWVCPVESRTCASLGLGNIRVSLSLLHGPPACSPHTWPALAATIVSSFLIGKQRMKCEMSNIGLHYVGQKLQPRVEICQNGYMMLLSRFPNQLRLDFRLHGFLVKATLS